MFTRAQNKKLINRFPFLLPRNVFTDKKLANYDYSFILGVDELPRGWSRLFLLFCKHLRAALLDHDSLDSFRFTQIKEKYGTMRLYNNGLPCNINDYLGKPNYRDNFDTLFIVYEHLSFYVCTVCGKPAEYMTKGWIATFCRDCFLKGDQPTKDCLREIKQNKLPRKNFKIKVHRYCPAKRCKVLVYKAKPYWREYLKCLVMTQDDFFNYLLED